MLDARLWFDDVEVGQDIPEVVKGPLSTAHIVRWSAAMENWHRIHYDQAFVQDHEKLPGLMVNGSWKQHVLVQMLKDWVDHMGWLWKISFQFRDMDICGDVVTAWGNVTDKYENDGLGFVCLDIGLRNSRGVESTQGKAVVVLPKRGGREVPYPFVTPKQ